MTEDVVFDYDFELVSIQINLQDIRLELGPLNKGLAVAFNGSFEVIGADGAGPSESIEAWTRSGDLRAIWRLIGEKMARIVMDQESFRLIFEDGTIIRAENGPFSETVNVWGPNTEPGREHLTRYPDDLTPGGSSEVREQVHRMMQQDPIVLAPKSPRDE